jgi:hypothetical protein
MRKDKRSLWKESEDKKLIDLLRIRGIGIDKIAQKLKRTEKAIRRRCERLNLSSSSLYNKKK